MAVAVAVVVAVAAAAALALWPTSTNFLMKIYVLLYAPLSYVTPHNLNHVNLKYFKRQTC